MPPIPQPDPLGMPVPVELLFPLKVFGFFLHMLFMHLWLAGLPTALILWRARPQISERLIAMAPFALAFGINAGIVPLLFIQTLYPQFFYPATILQAWPWFLIIPVLLIAYIAVYLAAFGRWRILTSLLACVLLIGIGFQFSAGMTLTVRPERWLDLFQASAPAGAVHGLIVYREGEVFLRFGLMFGMACGTVGAFLALAAEIAKERGFQSQARPLVPWLYGMGLVLLGALGSAYAPMVRDRLPGVLMLLAGGSMPVAFLAALLYRARPGLRTASGLAILHMLVLLSNAIAREVAQATELRRWVDVSWIPVRGEWGSLVLFLAALVVGLGIVGWMLRTVWARLRSTELPP